MFDPITEASKGNSFLKNVSTAREERQYKREQGQAIQLLQNHYRLFLAKKKTRDHVLDFISKNFLLTDSAPATTVSICLKKTIVIANVPKDIEIVISVLKGLIKSFSSSVLNNNIVSLCLNKNTVTGLMDSVKRLLKIIGVLCDSANVLSQHQRKNVTVIINFLLVLCNTNAWGVSKTLPPSLAPFLPAIRKSFEHLIGEEMLVFKLIDVFRSISVVAEGSSENGNNSSLGLLVKGIVRLITLQFEYFRQKEECQRRIAVQFFTIGGASVLIDKYAPDSLGAILQNGGIFDLFVSTISSSGFTHSDFVDISAERNLYVIGNYIHFNSLQMKLIADKPLTFLSQLFLLLKHLEKLLHENSKKNTRSEWHQLFGLVSSRVGCKIDCVSYVMVQLRHLWSARMVKALLGDLLDLNRTRQTSDSSSSKSDKKKLTMKRFFAW